MTPPFENAVGPLSLPKLMLVALMAGSAGCSDAAVPIAISADVPDPQSVEVDLSDSELAALVPDYLDAESMRWFEGNWGVVANDAFEGRSCQNGGFMTAVVDGTMFAMTAQPEPETDKTEPTSGRVRVSRGEEPGVFSLTPSDWEDAYFRLKPRSTDQLLAHLYLFDSDRTEWLNEYEFNFERCP